MFRLINSHLQTYSLQVKSQDAVHTLGCQCVYISEMSEPYHFYLQACSLQVKSQDAVHKMGSKCVYISEMFEPYHLPRTVKLAKYEAYSDSKYRFAVKKNRVSFLIKFYCDQIIHSSNYFSTYSPPLLSTYHSEAQVFVHPPQRMRPPITQTTADSVIE